MADESCGPTPAPSEPLLSPAVAMVQCVKFGREMPGLAASRGKANSANGFTKVSPRMLGSSGSSTPRW